METFLQSNSCDRGTYKPYRIDSSHIGATIVCPNCGQILSLIQHRIMDHGKVIPHVKCSYPGCTFHDLVTLQGWNHAVANFNHH